MFRPYEGIFSGEGAENQAKLSCLVVYFRTAILYVCTHLLAFSAFLAVYSTQIPFSFETLYSQAILADTDLRAVIWKNGTVSPSAITLRMPTMMNGSPI